MRSVDTNILLRYVLQDVPHQYELARMLLEESPPKDLMVADATIFEMVWILSGNTWKLDRTLIAKMLKHIIHLPQVSCQNGLFEKVLSLYVVNPGLSFIDIYLSLRSQLDNAVPLLTFDQKLAKKLPNLTQLMEVAEDDSKKLD